MVAGRVEKDAADLSARGALKVAERPCGTELEWSAATREAGASRQGASALMKTLKAGDKEKLKATIEGVLTEVEVQ